MDTQDFYSKSCVSIFRPLFRPTFLELMRLRDEVNGGAVPQHRNGATPEAPALPASSLRIRYGAFSQFSLGHSQHQLGERKKIGRR
jgi:hypothetical protein